MNKTEYFLSNPPCLSVPVSDADKLLGCGNLLCIVSSLAGRKPLSGVLQNEVPQFKFLRLIEIAVGIGHDVKAKGVLLDVLHRVDLVRYGEEAH